MQEAELENQIVEAKKKDIALYQSWEESVAFAERILSGDIDAYKVKGLAKRCFLKWI